MLVSLGLVVASIIPRVRVYHVDQRKIDKECAHKITFKYVFKTEIIKWNVESYVQGDQLNMALFFRYHIKSDLHTVHSV